MEYEFINVPSLWIVLGNSWLNLKHARDERGEFRHEITYGIGEAAD